MKKQFTYFISMLALGAALVGCGNSAQDTSSTPEVTQEVEVTTEPEATPEVEESVAEVIETPATDEVKPEDQTVATEVIPSISPSPEATTEPSTAKPSTESSSTTKPSTGSSSTTKPSTGSSSTTKPNAGTTTQPNSGTTTPEVKPEATPEVKPEVKPEATPEVTPEAKPETSLSASDVYAKAVAGVELPKQMEMDGTLISDIYGIDTSLLKSYKGMLPMMSMHINECVIFELKDAKDADQVIAGIQTRANNVGGHLYPSLQETFDARQIVTEGNYILFVMDDSVDTIVANFKAALQ